MFGNNTFTTARGVKLSIKGIPEKLADLNAQRKEFSPEEYKIAITHLILGQAVVPEKPIPENWASEQKAAGHPVPAEEGERNLSFLFREAFSTSEKLRNDEIKKVFVITFRASGVPLKDWRSIERAFAS